MERLPEVTAGTKKERRPSSRKKNRKQTQRGDSQRKKADCKEKRASGATFVRMRKNEREERSVRCREERAELEQNTRSGQRR